MEKGNLQEAANYYKKTLANQAFNFEANKSLAGIFYKQKDWNKAHEAYKKVIFLRPGERNVYSPYIHAFIKDEKIDKALEFIRNFKETHPIPLENIEDYLIIGEGFFNKGQTKEAIKYLLKVVEFMAYNYKAYFLLGKAYLESGQYRDGCEALEKAVRLNPKNAEGYYYLGIGYENIPQYHKAIEAFERAVLIDNKNIEGFYHLQNLYTKIGLKNNAIKMINLIENVATKAVEPAEWKGRAGENVYQNGNMYWQGTVSAPVILKEGIAKFILQAQGTPAKGGWPHMVVKLDDEIIGEVDVTLEKLKEYEFKKTAKPGKFYLNVTFTNDSYLADITGKTIEDRNLFVRKCLIVYE
jgi:tetratricopeptide (TPR) repeat protein